MTCLAPALTANLLDEANGESSVRVMEVAGRQEAASHGKDGSPTSDVEDDLVLEEVFVLHNGVHIRPRPHLIFLSPRPISRRTESGLSQATRKAEQCTHQHFLMNPFAKRKPNVSIQSNWCSVAKIKTKMQGDTHRGGCNYNSEISLQSLDRATIV